MLFTRSKNIDPSRIYCIFKITKYIQLPCSRSLYSRFSERVLWQYDFSSSSTCALKYKSDMLLVSYSVVSCGFLVSMYIILLIDRSFFKFFIRV